MNLISVNVNLNCLVSFRLTPQGKQDLEEGITRTNAVDVEYLPLPDGSYRMSLWQFVNVFGGVPNYRGGPGSLVDGLTITQPELR